ncbi:hypothetical protein KKH43_00995 [Patescibacteria group bacterium]|nr:hypothetical protein [Patescibacteria group bacterium]
MAVSKIVKIDLISLKKHEGKILDFLHNTGFVQIIDKQRMEGEEVAREEKEDFERRALDVDYVLSVLGPYAKKEKVSLADKVALGGKIKLTTKEYEDVVLNYDYKSVVSSVKKVESHIQFISETNSSLIEEQELLKKWINIDFDLSSVRESLRGQLIFGKLPKKQENDFVKKVGHEISEIEVLTVDSDESSAYMLVTFNKEKRGLFDEHAFEFGFEEVDLPSKGDTPRKHIASLEKTIKENTAEIKKLKKELKGIAEKDMRALKVTYDYFTWQKDMDNARIHFDLTNKSFLVSCWVQKSHLSTLSEGLKTITTDFYIQEVKPNKSEKTPVLIENRNFIKPFETVTKIYGLPKTNEVDPTPYLAPFFIVYFALCLTDAGYGLLLAVGTFLAIKLLKIPKEKQRLLKLLMYGGIMTFIIGALFGGWFGIESQYLPPFLQSIQVINPLDDVMLVLGLAASLGFIQILVGILIKLYWSAKNKDYSKEVLIDALWFVILLSGALWILCNSVFHIAVAAQILLILLLAAAFVVVWISGNNVFKNKITGIKEKEGKSTRYYTWLILGTIIGFPIRILTGILGLYTVVGYVSDVLSYSRLLALGLATGIIAMAINIIALLVKDMVPYAGYVLMILVLVGGHTFNIAINVLGAYIHSGRLQFVEFFPKFLEGGGEVFIPFERKGKYIELTAK